MAKIRWSPEAFERAESIQKYIENESPAAAIEFAKGILEQIENLKPILESNDWRFDPS